MISNSKKQCLSTGHQNSALAFVYVHAMSAALAVWRAYGLPSAASIRPNERINAMIYPRFPLRHTIAPKLYLLLS